ncbi:hypothetical protein AOL_s00091g37 [Orbilia oligospora ATCC 24927]|uniref:Uncharacterized protein n=1 Tax=Arthrobotrys oligospora (strain ATCC 24927 / CBS 115.81 / DSM 1491) TaxID=756982 RepID=G1XHY5_ARTOA|nr:hypothetical protein AOL_s00091g37 [Orbilia oligospora ATCC 24927]EGX47216.1 hypothetical protein AOL_s00091g37 [Orbilia oligospora ATCC 24927]
MFAENTSNISTTSDGNSTNCWLHLGKENFHGPATLLKDKKPDFDKVVRCIREEFEVVEKIELSHEMHSHLAGLSEKIKAYIHLLATAAPFIMCDCNDRQDKTIARLYFQSRSELAKVANNAHLAFLCRFKEKCELLDHSKTSKVLGESAPDLHCDDKDLELFRACMNLFGNLVYDITGIAPLKDSQGVPE